MNDVIQCILERRSIRKYKLEQITDEELDNVLQAGMYAPSAGGRQGVLFIVTQDANVNDRLGKINKAAYKGKISTDTKYISKEQPSIADDVAIKSGFYGAPTVITLLGAKNFLYGDSDCSVAAENMLLAAHSMGLGSCMIGRAFETFTSEYGKELLSKCNIDERYVPLYHILLGYPDCEQPKAKERRNNRVIKVN